MHCSDRRGRATIEKIQGMKLEPFVGPSGSVMPHELDEFCLDQQRRDLILLEETLLQDGRKAAWDGVAAMQLCICSLLRSKTEALKLIQGGLEDGKNYLDELPTGKMVWKKFSDFVLNTLGCSETCANMEDSVNDCLEARCKSLCINRPVES